MSLQFERVRDEAAARAWHEVAKRCDPHDHPGQPAPTLQEMLCAALRSGDADRALLLNASLGDRVVGTVLLWLPMKDNVHLAHAQVRLLPEHRGQGLGNELVAATLHAARAEGRTTLTGHVSETEPTGDPARAIAKRLGGVPALETLRQELVVRDLDDERLEALGRELVGGHGEGYAAVTWVDRVSDELVDDAAYLMSRMSTDAPKGELELEAETWDAARYREKEREAQEGGRTRLVGGAVERHSGRLVAYSDIGVAADDPSVAEQWDTIVEPAHRGHRLGVLAKLANLRQLRERSPATEAVQTYNAVSNGPMRAVNEQLGFVEVERYVAWQFSI